MAAVKLLHVEDDAGLRQFVRDELTDAGYTVMSVPNGVDAVKELQAQPDAYRLVILDLVLPWMNGLEVLEIVRRHPDMRRLPVLVTTGTMVTPGEFAGDRYVSVLAKPFDALQLRVAVEQLLLTLGAS